MNQFSKNPDTFLISELENKRLAFDQTGVWLQLALGFLIKT